MIENASDEPSARPPLTTLPALCRSGRSDLPCCSETKRVCEGRAASTDAASTAALPPLPAAGQEAVRTVPTTAIDAGASTVMMALPA